MAPHSANEYAKILHELFNRRKCYSLNEENQVSVLGSLPYNGIYVLFEEGETAFGMKRIVYVGGHTGEGKLASRLKEHYLVKNKDRSIFRKQIGRAILRGEGGHDDFLRLWNTDFTSREKRSLPEYNESYLFQKETYETKVSQYIQQNMSFAVVPLDDKGMREEVKNRIIATLAQGDGTRPSVQWLGNYSPEENIRQSGLWNVQHVWDEITLVEGDVRWLSSLPN